MHHITNVARIAMLSPFLLCLAAQQPAAASREARVLELLRTLPLEGLARRSTPIVERTNAYGCTVFAPDLRGVCGLGWRPAFDPRLARSLARQVCGIYGLHVVADAPAPAGVAAVLDSLDAEAGIALELRGRVESRELPVGGSWPTVVDEAAADDLDVEEQRTLAGAQVTVFTADVQAFWEASSDDRFTTTLAYLASVVRFLNERTDGEHVDLSAMLGAATQHLPVRPPRAKAGLSVAGWFGGGGFTLETDSAREVVLPIDVKAAFDVGTGESVAPRSNRGRPTLVQCSQFAVDRGKAVLVLRQRGVDGRERDLAVGREGVLLVPGTFDSTRPFSLVLRLEPGQYRLGTALWVATPAG